MCSPEPCARPLTRLVRPVDYRQCLGIALLYVSRAVSLRKHAHTRLDLAQLPRAPTVYPVTLIGEQLQPGHVVRSSLRLRELNASDSGL